MKNVILLLLLVVMAAIGSSCSKSDTPKPDYSKFMAHVSEKKSTLKAMTGAEVVKNTLLLQFDKAWTTVAQKDTINMEIIIPSYNIINQYNELDMKFMNGKDVVLMNKFREVVAYIPNATMDRGRTLIVNAFNGNKLDSCLWYLKHIYQFIPIDDADYKALEAQDLN